MQTNTKLVLGGIAGVIAAGAMFAGLFALSSSSASPPTPEARPVEPVPAPALEPALATTHAPRIEAPAVAPAPAPEPSYEPELASGAIRLRRLVVATGVERHEPTGARDVFELGGQRRVYAFVDAVNETDEEVALRVTFEPERGESAGHVALEIPANVARFRTWAYTRHVYEPGRWEVVVRAPDGRVIARRPFDVVE